MNHTTVLRTGIASAVAAAGLTLGGVALASADDGTGADDSTSQEQADGDRHGFGRGPGGPGGHGPGGPGGEHLADLADELGVSEDELQSAFEAVRDDVRPGGAGAAEDGQRPDRDEMRDALVTALAEELGVSEGEVSDAFDELGAEERAEHRDALVERLDEAVADGDLTGDDAASVLKAYDAGVLGGGPLR